MPSMTKSGPELFDLCPETALADRKAFNKNARCLPQQKKLNVRFVKCPDKILQCLIQQPGIGPNIR